MITISGRFHAALSIAFLLIVCLPESQANVWVNDVHSRANRISVAKIVKPASEYEVQSAVRRAKIEGKAISIAGGRHAMGGQQFGTNTILLDMSQMNRVLAFDPKKGWITVESGIQWPELVNHLIQRQKGREHQWGIRQKQTGADRLSIGGALSANVHGRGLAMKPFIEDVESFTLINSAGERVLCSRRKNRKLFNLAIGGYGLFGVITHVTLRLSPRTKLERIVEVISLQELLLKVEKRKKAGFLYGDFQFSIDPQDKDFLTRGVFSCYRHIDKKRPISSKHAVLSNKEWAGLNYLAHTDKKKVFEVYSKYYLATSGQLYWSDLHQMSTYNDNYHESLDRRLGTGNKANEMITEIYVPRKFLEPFMHEARALFRKKDVNVIYGTIRFIEKDDESFLAWARESYACIIFNLHFVHTPKGIDRASHEFRALIDLAIKFKGRYYLTYHRYATRSQVEACYPQFEKFLYLKLKHDPEERFQSDWYRHYREMFGIRNAIR